MSSNGVGSSGNSIDPATGRCRFHPGIKLLLSRNDDGEWRTILKACPLCVSGLPPTAAASAVAAEAAAARNHNNDGVEFGDGHVNGPSNNNDPDEKILLKKQKKKRGQQQRHEKSPRSRPRSPSPQSPYKRSMHEDEKDEHSNSNGAINDSTPINRKLFEEGFATSHSSAPSLQPRSHRSEYSDEEESLDRMNQNAFRQYINRDREEQLEKEGGGSKNDSGTVRGLDQDGMRNNLPPLNGDYNHSNYYSIDGGQQRHTMDVERNGSTGSYHSSSTLSARTDHRSDVSSQGSYYSSSQSDRRQSEGISEGSKYSSPRSLRKSGDEVSDIEGSYYSSEEGTYEGNNTESDTGSYASYHEEQSMGGSPRMEGTVNSYPTSRDVYLQQHSHNGHEQSNEWPSSRMHPQTGGSDVQHQQWSPQKQQYQSYHHTTSSPTNYIVRPDPDSHNYHPNNPTQITAAERMMRHQQSTMSPSRSKNDTASYQQAQMQTQIDSRESDDDEDDVNERDVLEPEDVSIISMNSSASRNLKRAKEQKRREEQERGSQVDPDGDDEDDRPIKTCEYDDRGRCVRHPQYQLRKKKMFKGWVTLLSNCPECCLDEMKRVKKKYHDRVSSPVGVGSVHSNGGSSSGKKKKKKKSRKKSSSQLPPITQLNVSNNRGGAVDDNSSSGTASTFTVGSSNTSGRWQNYLTSNTSVASAPTTTARVTRLPYDDQTNGNGWYTGQVSMAGIPHGWGIMNYANGQTFEGEWRNGVSIAKSKEAPPALGSGASNFGSPPPHSFTNDHQRRGSYSDPPVPRRRISQLEPLREDPPSTSRSRNETYSRSRIVNNMPFRDDRGFVIGAYTGEVDEYHVPNGIGKMRYNDGFVSEGRWTDGELDDGYNVTDDEEEDDDNNSYKSRSAMSAPGVTAYYRHDSYRQDRNFLPTSYSGQNLSSKLSGLEQKLSTMGFNNQH